MLRPKRTSPWKQVIRGHGPAFLTWLDVNGVRFRLLDKLASDLERYLLDVLHACVNCEVGEQQCYEEFVAAIRKVLARCDEDIYDQPHVAALAQTDAVSETASVLISRATVLDWFGGARGMRELHAAEVDEQALSALIDDDAY